MLLTITIFAPLAGALVLTLLPKGSAAAARWIALATSVAVFVLSVVLALRFHAGQDGFQLGQRATWVRALGISYRVGVDGISLPLVVLTTFLTALGVIASWRMTDRVRGYMAVLLVMETVMLGVFCALDMFLFYIFWEGMLVPMYFLIGSWGGERRVYAAVKFFLYTLLGGLVMFVGILGLFYLQRRVGPPTFDYEAFRSLAKDPTTQRWLFLAFFAAFAVKIPLVPFHTWLPDAYVEAPTATTVLLSGVLSKMGVYGLLRFSIPLFPSAARALAPLVLVLAVVSILYCAVVAAIQKDFKRLVAYSSVSHLGFIVLGVAALTLQGLQGGVFYMVAHGLTTGGLFFLIGMLYERRGTNRIDAFGGLQRVVPRMAGVMLFVSLGSVALPGLVNFVGEFLTLLGAFLTHRVYAVLGVLGVILAAVYLLWAYQRMWQGPLVHEENRGMRDLTPREWAVLAPVIALTLVLGLFPRPVLDRAQPAANRIMVQVDQASRK